MRVLLLGRQQSALPPAVRLALFEDVQIFVSFVDDCDDALVMATSNYDLVVLVSEENWICPARSVARFKKRNSATPVVVIGLGILRQREIIDSYNAGVDGYLESPRENEEVSAYLKAVLRRSCGSTSSLEIRCGDLRIDTRQRKVFVAGVPRHLSPTEYQVLETVALRQGRIIHHQDIFLSVWGEDVDRHESNQVHVYLNRIRKKLSRDPEKYIKTLRGHGYLMP